MMKTLGILMFATALAAPATAQEVIRGEGGPMQFNLGSGYFINEHSSLQRQWAVVNDPTMPASFSDLAGISVAVGGRDMIFEATAGVVVVTPLTAIEVRFILFDLWGHMIRTLSLTKVQDLAPGEHRLTGQWDLRGNEASSYYASIGFVARVRTADGPVVEMDLKPVVDEGLRFTDEFSVEDVEGQDQP